MVTDQDKSRALDANTVAYYVAKGRVERSRAFTNMIRAIFSSPARAERPAPVGSLRPASA